MRVRRLGLLALLLTTLLLGFGSPTRVVVGDRSSWAWRNTTVAEATAASGYHPPHGNLVDVAGNVLVVGQGGRAIPRSGGRPIGYGHRARHQRVVTFEPGEDRCEPLVETARLIAGPARPDWRDSWRPTYLAFRTAVPGITRSRRGAISGLMVAPQVALATPIATESPTATTAPRRIALTFDDGPNGSTTREILAIMDRYGARATFFMLADKVGRQQDLVREVVSRGHEVGNHSWGHPNFRRLSVAACMANIAKAEKAISSASGQRCRWFRPPYGETTAAQRKALLEAGYSIALWSCDTQDWRRPGSETIYRRIVRGAKPGAVVLMHDGGPRAQTVAALRKAVPELQRMGYDLVTMSELESALPEDDAGMVLTTLGGTHEARIPQEPVHVFVYGRELELEPVLVTEGKFLVPAPTVLDALGVRWEWDRTSETVKIASHRGRFRLRLDSRDLTWDGRELTVDVPPMLYHDTPLVSLQLLARATGATLYGRREPNSFDLTPSRLPVPPAPPR